MKRGRTPWLGLSSSILGEGRACSFPFQRARTRNVHIATRFSFRAALRHLERAEFAVLFRMAVYGAPFRTKLRTHTFSPGDRRFGDLFAIGTQAAAVRVLAACFLRAEPGRLGALPRALRQASAVWHRAGRVGPSCRLVAPTAKGRSHFSSG